MHIEFIGEQTLDKLISTIDYNNIK